MILNNSERTKCEVWSRVMGYMRPVTDYNIGKKQEFKDRRNFKEQKAIDQKLINLPKEENNNANI